MHDRFSEMVRSSSDWNSLFELCLLYDGALDPTISLFMPHSTSLVLLVQVLNLRVNLLAFEYTGYGTSTGAKNPPYPHTLIHQIVFWSLAPEQMISTHASLLFFSKIGVPSEKATYADIQVKRRVTMRDYPTRL